MADEQEFSVILSKADKITEEMIQLMIELYKNLLCYILIFLSKEQ